MCCRTIPKLVLKHLYPLMLSPTTAFSHGAHVDQVTLSQGQTTKITFTFVPVS